MNKSVAPVGVCSLQFWAFKRDDFLSRLSLTKWNGQRVFTAVELGANPNHFDYPSIVGGLTGSSAIQQLHDDLGNNGFLPMSDRGEVSAHPIGMGICAKNIHPGWAGFLGDRVWTTKSNGWPDEEAINRKAYDEICLVIQAVKAVGGADLNMFFGSSIEGFRRQFPHESGAPAITVKECRLDIEFESWEDQMMEADAKTISLICREADNAGVFLNVEPHPGENFWGYHRMVRFLRSCYQYKSCQRRLRLKMDPSHWKMHGYDPAEVVRALTAEFKDLDFAVIRKIHWKWSSFNPGGLRGTDGVEHLGPRDGSRASSFIAVQYGDLQEQTEFWYALQAHGVDPYQTGAMIEHEMDEMEALTSASVGPEFADPAFNSCELAGLHVFQFLRGVYPGGSHQDRMQKKE